MSLAINNNLAASNAARNLGAHYTNLTKSVRRLSSGLRVSTAADDAAGLAIRELMRADITALNQGARNVNDAISMLQTADGALGIIDEKLIRMKELAEQAATGTYNSDQRLMIDSEFQAMAAEIDRIANATDFNGQKILDGKFATTTEIVGADGKTYDITLDHIKNLVIWPGATAAQQGGWDTSGITNPGALVGTKAVTVTNNNIPKIGDNYLLVTPTNSTTNIPPGSTVEMSFTFITAAGNKVYGDWTVGIDGATPTDAVYGDGAGFTWNEPNGGDVHIQTTLVDANGNPAKMTESAATTWTAPGNIPSFTSNSGNATATLSPDGSTLDMTIDLGNGNTVSSSWDLTYGNNVYEPSTVLASTSFTLEVRDTTPKADDPGADDIPDNVVKIHFGAGNDKAEDYYYIEKQDATIKGLGLEGVAIKTQATAQDAIEQIDGAIIKKDKIRAYFGATQNRLENTLSNIRIQAENLGTAESQLSDVDISQEMTNFVRNQILVQSGVAMLAQANALPRMALQLLNG